jgi:hypothetical protein
LFAGKMHLTSLYLLDIISSLVARRFELAGVGRAPGRQPFPVFQPLPQAAAWTRWRRRSSSAGLQLAAVSRAFLVELRRRAVRLAVGEFLAVSRVEGDDYVTFR